jgi:iron(II)-dependent oxidoreductase
VLVSDHNVPYDHESIAAAKASLQATMALVPGGNVCLLNDVAMPGREGPVFSSYGYREIRIETFYIDRHAVTNEAYAMFVRSGGYANAELWPEEILPNVLRFVDQTGAPGPKHWSQGKPLPGKEQHPVVGICWYEANAYALWCGKRLPSAGQWQRSGTWATTQRGEGLECRFPWGNAFDPQRANLRVTGRGETAPVTDFSTGSTPNGITQLIGNVWEWTNSPFKPTGIEATQVILEAAMAEVRGGAFDTYFHSHSTCQFRSGQPLLTRAKNIGFRCCVAVDVVNSDHRDNDEANLLFETDQELTS